MHYTRGMSDDDINEFRKAMKGVIPLKDSGKLSKQRPAPTPKLRKANRHTEELASGLTDAIPHPVGPEDILSYVKTGVNRQDWKAIKLGECQIQGRLDLHGHPIDSARKALIEFIDIQLQNKHRVVRIIHGKAGGFQEPYPVLKNLVASWLKQLPGVLAFHSTPPRQGGAGALNVLLKSYRGQISP